MSDYPNREQFFANRLIRLMGQSEDALVMGTDAFGLVCYVVMTEDRLRYRRPCLFYNREILNGLGFKSWNSLNRARSNAAKLGWLHYEAGETRGPGTYWATIPTSVTERFGHDTSLDYPCVRAHEDPVNVYAPSHRAHAGAHTGAHTGEPSIPVPRPEPEEESLSGETDAAATSKAKRGKYPEHFDRVWKAFPRLRRGKKHAAFQEYKSAVQSVAESQGISHTDAQRWILSRVEAFAGSYAAEKYPPHCHQWFKDDRYDEPDAAWADFNRTNGTACPEFALAQQAARSLVPGDVASLNEVQAKLPEDVFKAARPMLYEITNPYQEKTNRINFAKRLEELRG